MACVYVPNWFSGLSKIFLLLLVTIILTIIVFLYSLKPILKNNWNTYHCHPMVMPFTQFFVGKSPIDNFHKCIGKDVKKSSKKILSPYNDLFQSTTETLNALNSSIQEAAQSTNQDRTQTSMSISSLFGRMGNLSTTSQFLMVKIQTIFQKIVALYVSLLYAAFSVLKGVDAIVNDPSVKTGQLALDRAARII